MSFLHACSFCGNERKALIVGPRVSICHECVKACNVIVSEKEKSAKQKEYKDADI